MRWPWQRKTGELSADLPDGIGTLYSVRVSSEGRCLTRTQLSGLSVGRRHWWLKHNEGWFVRLALSRGDRPVNVTTRLPTGQYTLGVGTGTHAIRIILSVRAE